MFRKRRRGESKRNFKYEYNRWYTSIPENKLRIAKRKRSYYDDNPFMLAARLLRLHPIFEAAGLPLSTNPRDLVFESNLTNELLETISKGNGIPDWPKEHLEEKKAGDCLTTAQWARAILDIRRGLKYRIAWRYSSSRRKVFDNVFDFWEWVINEERKRKLDKS